jgi:protein SCO1/2
MQQNELNRSLFVFPNMRFVVSLLGSIVLLFSCEQSQKKHVLPFIGNYDIEYKLIDGKEVADTVYPSIPSFSFLNQDSIRVSKKDFNNKIWIADFFFTTCPTICPVMTRNLKDLHERTADLHDHLQFLSFSVNPDFDQPSVLKRYRKHYGIDADNWDFLTGNEEETHRLGIENFQIFAGRDEEAEGGFAHSGAFTLVDKEGYVRGVYLGTDKRQVRQLEVDLRKLLKEEYGITGSK